MRVAIVGAGNADDLPLTRLAARAGLVDLIDIDVHASRRAIRREPRALRRRMCAVEQDVTDGHADRIVAAAAAGRAAPPVPAFAAPIGDGGYDLVLGDLFYSQLVWPALRDLDIPQARRVAVHRQAGPALTDAVVRRLHGAARGTVVHLHDVAGWWPGHPQPATLDSVLQLEPATVIHQRLNFASSCDPRASVARLGLPIADTAMWRWPFAGGVDYLVLATVCVDARGDRRSPRIDGDH